MMIGIQAGGARDTRADSALWWGLLLAVASTACNALLFAGQHAERVLVWFSVLFAGAALVFLGWGLKRFFAGGAADGSKVKSSILAVVSALLVAANIFGFIHARAVPVSAGAPQVGQKIPDFTLPDTHNQPVLLSGLFASGRKDAPPKAVLLVFYRGYW